MSSTLFLLQFLYASLCCYRRLRIFQYDSNSECYRLIGSMATAHTIRKPWNGLRYDPKALAHVHDTRLIFSPFFSLFFFSLSPSCLVYVECWCGRVQGNRQLVSGPYRPMLCARQQAAGFRLQQAHVVCKATGSWLQAPTGPCCVQGNRQLASGSYRPMLGARQQAAGFRLLQAHVVCKAAGFKLLQAHVVCT